MHHHGHSAPTNNNEVFFSVSYRATLPGGQKAAVKIELTPYDTCGEHFWYWRAYCSGTQAWCNRELGSCITSLVFVCMVGLLLLLVAPWVIVLAVYMLRVLVSGGVVGAGGGWCWCWCCEIST